MTGKASWEWDFTLANAVIHLLWNIKSSVLSLKWQSPSSNIVSASNRKKSWWGCEEAECSTKLVSASIFHLRMQMLTAQFCSSYKIQDNSSWEKALQAHPSSPSFTAVCLNHLCAFNSPRHVPWCPWVWFNEHKDVLFEPGTLQSQAPLCPAPQHVSAPSMQPLLPLNLPSDKWVLGARRNAFTPISSFTFTNLFFKNLWSLFFFFWSVSPRHIHGTKTHIALFSSIYFLRNHESLLFHWKSFAILSMEWGAWLPLEVPLPKGE